MSSASNGLVVLAVARVATVDAFGAATLLFAFAAAAIGVGRGALGTPIMLAAGRGDDGLRREAAFAATTALSFGLGVSGVVVASSAVLGVPLMGAAFALALPLAVLVDVFRYTLISASRPHVAMAWDAVWAAGSALLFAITIIQPRAVNDVAIILLWAVFAAISATGMASNLRLGPRFRGIRTWWRRSWGPRIRYGLESGLSQINVIIVASIAASIIGVSAAASLRGAATLLSPLAVLLSALPLMIIPEAVRSGASETEVWRKLCWIGVGASLMVAALGPALVLVPETIGEMILGESWNYARSVLPVISLEYAAIVWSSIAMSFLRFQGRSATLLVSIVAYCSLSIVLCAAMALITDAAIGVAWALVASAVVLAAFTIFYARPARERL